MATLLTLSQDLARESGTMASATISSTSGVTGRQAKFVGWVIEAWKQIQNKHKKTWRFLRKSFSSSLAVGTNAYAASAFSLSDHAEWLLAYEVYTVYRTSVGVSEEYPLIPLAWEDFRRTYLRGTQTPGMPRHFSVSPDNRLYVGPAPSEAMTINGDYIRKAQILAVDSDEPICPEDYHSIIVWYALVHLAEHDEGAFQVATAQRKYGEYYNAMAASQLPTPVIGAPPLA